MAQMIFAKSERLVLDASDAVAGKDESLDTRQCEEYSVPGYLFFLVSSSQRYQWQASAVAPSIRCNF